MTAAWLVPSTETPIRAAVRNPGQVREVACTATEHIGGSKLTPTLNDEATSNAGPAGVSATSATTPVGIDAKTSRTAVPCRGTIVRPRPCPGGHRRCGRRAAGPGAPEQPSS
jgi:hypothetical protein